MRLTAILGSSSLLVASLVAVAGAACADGAQEPRFPEAQPTAAAPVDNGDATRVPQRPSNADIRAELEAAQRKDVSNAVAHGDGNGDGGAAPTGGDSANANANAAGADGGAPGIGDVDVERRDFEAKVRERLARIDARARELKEKGTKLAGTKKTSFETSLRRVTTERSDVEAKLGTLSKSAAWKTSKANVERSLDDLESTLAKLDDQV